MQIVPETLKKVELAGAQLVAVTKYFSPKETEKLVHDLIICPAVFGFGENRSDVLSQKNIPREKLHFIGNIQSRNIPIIAEYCSVVHSLCSVKHAALFAKQKNIPSFFIEVNVSYESQKSGIYPDQLEQFLRDIAPFNLPLLGISTMGAGDFNEEGKQNEFRLLRSLRDTFLPGTRISAGTSRDFEIALQEGIEVVRIGQALFSL
jgi:uncharacterized pyridoxal phosphate-containing UPF0001 family protein